jgi:hypothetical protein
MLNIGAITMADAAREPFSYFKAQVLDEGDLNAWSEGLRQLITITV